MTLFILLREGGIEFQESETIEIQEQNNLYNWVELAAATPDEFLMMFSCHLSPKVHII